MPAIASQIPLSQRSWKKVYEWSGFKLDALGLITLLGLQEVDYALGQLTHNGYLEYLPFLAANVVAADTIAKPLPGYRLFNLTDGVEALDVSAWFTHWLEHQRLQYASTKIRIHQRSATSSSYSLPKEWPFMVPAILLAGILLCLATQSRNVDDSGLAIHLTNVICLIGTVVCRTISLTQMRAAVDQVVLRYYRQPHTAHNHKECDVWLALPSGKSVRIEAQKGHVLSLLTLPRLLRPKLYDVSRGTCWVMVAGHAVTLGSTSLLYQAACITSMIASTVLLLCRPRWACTKEAKLRIGNVLEFEIVAHNFIDDTDDRHSHAYARMNMEPEMEESMVAWGLMPHTRNSGWWNRYQDVKQRVNGNEAKTCIYATEGCYSLELERTIESSTSAQVGDQEGLQSDSQTNNSAAEAEVVAT